MASITFGGLASGIDTDSIITQLMNIEKKPLTRLENDKSYLNTRLTAFSNFNTKLKALETAIEDLDSTNKFRSYSATLASEEYFSIQTSSSSKAGSYNVEVVNLAQVQKTASVGYASSSTSTFSAGIIDISGTTITVDPGDNLANIVDKINSVNTGDTATGVSAALINDGTTNGFRIVLTGQDASTEFTATATGVSADSRSLTFASTQTAQQASVIVDGLPIVSNNNTLKNAIPGVDLTLLKKNTTGATTQLSVDVDNDGVKVKLNTFVSAYNDIIKFITDQKDTSWANDSSLQSAKRRLQNMLVDSAGGSGSLHRLAEIGISTDKKDGTISLDSSKIDKIISEDFQSLENLFIGEDGSEGINDKFINYLSGLTDSTTGLYASKKKSTESAVKGIEKNIDNMELRLEKREKSMRSQFEALELLMSSMNATSTYLSQQISSMNSSKG
ncbi:flagellar filament capping protein FliD [uncultured Desulfobulbus sp.]|uniref:flagellar filament capping protein FliD n=1 Tax=uncultured Desulfobulbus sp. TaxID=239745 RepID=UPI0029C77AB3|nr:flagellar filament capping protein FliD [uncultured Desulfobulbus sp.]